MPAEPPPSERAGAGDPARREQRPAPGAADGTADGQGHGDTSAFAPAPLRRSVGTRLTAAALAAALAISVLVAMGLAVQSWKVQMRAVEQTVDSLRLVTVPALTTAAWDFAPGLDSEVASLLRLPHVAGVRLDTRLSPIAFGTPPENGDLVWRFPLDHPQGGRLGELVVSFDTGSLRSAVLHDALWLALALTVVVLATAALVLVLFRSLVGRHLDDLARYAHSLTLDTLGQSFRLRRRPGEGDGDELDRLARSLAAMRGNLGSEIDRRNRAEGELAASQERYREVFDATGEAIFVHDAATGEILEANRSAQELYRTDRTAIVARGSITRLSQGDPPYDAAHAAGYLSRAIAEGPQLFEWRARDGDGRTFWVEVFLKAVTIGGRARVIASVRDIEQRKRIEEQVRHMQRMESVGQLAGGVAHDFNNMLAGIQGSIELAQLRLGTDHPCRRNLDTAFRASQRAAELTRKLLTVARRNRHEAAPVDVHQAIEAAVGLFAHALPPGIVLDRALQAHRTVVVADAAELQNAVLNLLLNSRDALTGGGHIAIITADAMLDAAACMAIPGFTLRPGPHLRLAIQDDGGGIAPDVLPRIFEPFFTTKAVGKGTGLGLSAVYGTVVSLGGAVTVRSAPGEGSTFTLLLPCAPEGAAAEASGQHRIRRLAGGRFLVVDDDAAARGIAAEMIEVLGGTVLQAADCDAAIAAIAGGSVDAILLDLVMPGRTGVEAFQTLRRAAPAARIVLCTGHQRDIGVDRLLAGGDAAFIAKPFRLAELAQALERPRPGS